MGIGGSQLGAPVSAPQAPVATPDRWRKDGADGPQDVNGLQAAMA